MRTSGLMYHISRYGDQILSARQPLGLSVKRRFEHHQMASVEHGSTSERATAVVHGFRITPTGRDARLLSTPPKWGSRDETASPNKEETRTIHTIWAGSKMHHFVHFCCYFGRFCRNLSVFTKYRNSCHSVIALAGLSSFERNPHYRH